MSEYIKREDAIAEAKAWSMYGKDNLITRIHRIKAVNVKKIIESVIVPCIDCKYNDGCCHCINYQGNNRDIDYCSYGKRKEQEHE